MQFNSILYTVKATILITTIFVLCLWRISLGNYCVCAAIPFLGSLVGLRVFPRPSLSHHPAVSRNSATSQNLAGARCWALGRYLNSRVRS